MFIYFSLLAACGKVWCDSVERVTGRDEVTADDAVDCDDVRDDDRVMSHERAVCGKHVQSSAQGRGGGIRGVVGEGVFRAPGRGGERAGVPERQRGGGEQRRRRVQQRERRQPVGDGVGAARSQPARQPAAAGIQTAGGARPGVGRGAGTRRAGGAPHRRQPGAAAQEAEGGERQAVDAGAANGSESRVGAGRLLEQRRLAAAGVLPVGRARCDAWSPGERIGTTGPDRGRRGQRCAARARWRPAGVHRG